MKVLIVADIHGNATALRAVFNDAGDVDALWCVGDIVGYGPDPAECIEMIRKLPNICIAGNHDVGVVGNISRAGSAGVTGSHDAVGGRDAEVAGSDGSVRDAGSAENIGDAGSVGTVGGVWSAGAGENAGDAAEENVASDINAGSFNPEAKIARDWTRSVLGEEQISFLARLPLMAEPLPSVLMAHGAPVASMPVFRAYGAGEPVSESPASGENVSSETGSSDPDSGAPGQDEDASDRPASGEPGLNASSPNDRDYNSSTSDQDTSEPIRVDLHAYEITQADIHEHENTQAQNKKQDSQKGNNGNLGIWEYVTSSWQAEEIFSMSQHGFVQELFIVGHTHVPLAFVKGDGAGVEYVPLETGDIIELDYVSFKYLLNPGSVGQPRDGDPRASYMLYDTEANVIEYRRVEYDVAEVIDRVDSVGLPHNLGARLEIGL